MKIFGFLLLFGLVSVIWPRLSPALDSAVFRVVINQEDKGDIFVKIADDGGILISEKDLQIIGVRKYSLEKAVMADDEWHIHLKSIDGTKYSLDDKTLILDITFPPDILATHSSTLQHQWTPKNIEFIKGMSAFLNYGITYSSAPSRNIQDITVANEFGLRTADLFFSTHTLYTTASVHERFLRLMSSLTYERRNQLQRIVLGDFSIPSIDGWSSLTMGGISFQKHYGLNPYFIKQPLINLSGSALYPSEVEYYLNDSLIKKERVSPGQFVLNDIVPNNGAGTIRAVLKDAFGRAEEISQPYYFDETLLKSGLHEYSYNIGFIRNHLGEKSNSYGSLVFSGIHKYGINNSLTMGIRADISKHGYNAGIQSSVLAGNYGILNLSMVGSHYDNRNGFASMIAYSFRTKGFNFRAFGRTYSKDYATIKDKPYDVSVINNKMRHEIGAMIGYNSERLGSFSVEYSANKKSSGYDSKSYSVGYSKSIMSNISFFAVARQLREERTNNQIMVGINYYPGKGISLSSYHRNDGDTHSTTVQIQKNPPSGQGFGFNVLAGTSKLSSGDHVNVFSPSFQYNSPYGIYSGQLQINADDKERTEMYRLSAYGGIAFIDNMAYAGRSVNGGFGIVYVEDLEGVRVYHNNNEVGKTDASGKAFIPHLIPYIYNKISISDRDIPIGYLINEIDKYIHVPDRSGASVRFGVKKMQAFAGRLSIRIGNNIKPVEFKSVKMIDSGNGNEISFSALNRGEFYFEDAVPGEYNAAFSYDGRTCSFDMTITKTEDPVMDMGEIVCEELN